MDAKNTTQSATLTVGGNSFELPVLSGTIGPDVVDISKLYAQSGMFTYDPGFTSTGSCQSKITYIDGDQGMLLYRGYPIEQLAEQGESSRPATCCFTANCRPRRRRKISTTASPITRWCTSR